MQKARLAAIPEKEVKSPYGRYHLFRRSISEALGGKKDLGTWAGGHPFDLEVVRLPPGARNFPLHAHSAQWEMYVIVSGCGQARGTEQTVPVEPGDNLIFPPGEAHQLINTGDTDLVYYVIADHSPADVTYYPEKDAWGIKPQRKHFKMTEVPYYDGED